MNHNIEVINDKLWAVKFTHIPFIKEIEYKPNLEIVMFEEPARITDDGLLLLNKDNPGYLIYKDMFINLTNKTDKQLTKERIKSQKLKTINEYQILYSAMLQVEQERRTKAKKQRGLRNWLRSEPRFK